MQGIKAPIKKHSKLDLDDGTNPHSTTKSDVGLGNADNTSDADKPISTATQTALNAKISADGSIDTHSDVDTSTVAPVNGDFLRWDGAANKWEPDTLVSTTYTYRKSFVAERNGTITAKLALGNGSDIATMGVVITEDCTLVCVGVSSSSSTSGQWQIFKNNSAIHTTVTTGAQNTVDNIATPISLAAGDFLNAHCNNAGGFPSTVTFEVEITKTIAGLKGEQGPTGPSGSVRRFLKLTNDFTNNVNNSALGVTFSAFNTTPLDNDFGSDLTVASDKITFNISGKFRCDFNFYLLSVAQRTNVLFVWMINGIFQRGRSAHDYIRASSNHNNSSAFLSEVLEFSSGDELQIKCFTAGNVGTVSLTAGQSIFTIEGV
jgi:hypothetical protein